MQHAALSVRFVAPEGQAKTLGVQVGDEIVSYDGKPIDTGAALRQAIQAASKSEGKIPFVVKRDGKAVTIELAPGRIGIRSGHRYTEPVWK